MKMNKKWMIPATMMLAAGLLVGAKDVVQADSVDMEPYITFGADLKQKEKDTVLELLEIEGDLEDYQLLTITNADEHKYLDGYLSSSVIGSRALSSVKIEKAEPGEGIYVETKNISYCTPEMYQNALTTAGVKDAYVTVVGPYEISGTSALVGVMKAYEDMTDRQISAESKDAAINELVVNGELAEELGDKEKATELLAYVKQNVSEKDKISKEEMQDVLDEGCEIYGVELTPEQEAEVLSLMDKIDDLDLNVDDLKKQAKDIYQEIKNSNLDTDGILQKILKIIRSILGK